MPLFDIKRTNNKAQDKKNIARSKSAIRTNISLKHGDSLMSRINQIIAKVEQYLGKYRDDYLCIQDEQSLIDYIDACISDGGVALDTETTGVDVINDDIVGISLYTTSMKPAYIPLNHISYITQQKVPGQLPVEFVAEQLNRLYSHDIESDMCNADFDIRVLWKIGARKVYCTWDCYLAMRVLNENEPSNRLKDMHQKFVLKGAEPEFTFDKLFEGITFNYIPINIAYLYAAHDAVDTRELRDYQAQHLRPDHEREDMRNLYWVFKNIEMPCVLPVASMEDNGVLFDFDYNQQLKDKYHPILEERIANFHKACEPYEAELDALRRKGVKLDKPLNIASVQQLQVLLYDVMGFPLYYDKKKREETKGTSEDALLLHKDDPVVSALLSYRELATIVGTFIDKLPECVAKDGRIHCTFKQYGADTGRFSSKDPNLQNIPSHMDDIRPMFRASEGYVFLSADYSQQEIKGMAQMCQDEGMIEAFRQGKDFYAEIASVAFGYPYEECLEFRPDGTTNKDGKMRRAQAKSILLGINYGRGAESIAEQIGCTKQEAERIKELVFKGFPAIAEFEHQSYDMVNTLGYVTTLWGRKRRLPSMLLPDYEFRYTGSSDDVLDFGSDSTLEVPDDVQDYWWDRITRAKFKDRRKVFEQAKKQGIQIIDHTKDKDYTKVVNARIQGTAADMTKLAMSALYRDDLLTKLGFRLLIQVHDEIIAECPKENAKEVVERFAKVMSEAPGEKFVIPISCDVTITDAWYGKEIAI